MYNVFLLYKKAPTCNTNVIYLEKDDNVMVRVFEKLELDSINDLISFGTKSNIFLSIDCEEHAIFNIFPEEDFKTELKLDDIDLSDIYPHEDFVFSKAKGKEKEITAKALFDLFENFSA